ncbi:EAL domain-containing protein [Motiliproteus sp. MSK22-1]|uniref:bifunctional diguanylate cyclase/phosphodiesterase n=1 Tax=Motiliproteus sp. MSK22-1 TaxID=1897630 RepID=UPI0009777A43|nr:EAL domain-containing protein [Motiliproteus sp. MSK22-1]OMH38786.1 hypothetical protein BGP75_06320 [Motiliproteus sp. MSK22-1]
MTLYRQLVLLFLLFFSLVLGGFYALEFNSSREFLSHRMKNDVLNRMVLLDLSLLPSVKSGDRRLTQAIVDTLFESGGYLQIEVEFVDSDKPPVRNSLIHQNENTLMGSKDVPEWFVGLGLFDAFEESRVLEDGEQLAVVRVTGDATPLYGRLWQQMSGQLFWYISIFILALIGFSYSLKRILRPLDVLDRQTEQLENQSATPLLSQPGLGELRGVVSAFNSISKRLQTLLKTQADEADDLRRRAFQDDLTGLGNRVFFDAQMEQWLAEPGGGAVMLLGIPYLEKVYIEEGYRARDELLCALQEVLASQFNKVPGSVLSRVSVKEFGAILPGLDAEQVEALAEKIVRNADIAIVDPFGNSRQICRVGAAIREPEATPSQLFSQADLALQQASRDAVSSFRIHKPDSRQMVLGREGWKGLAVQALEHDWFYFQTQPVISLSDGEQRYLELFTGIEKEGVRYGAGQFMPFVEQFNLGALLDRYVLQQLVKMPLPRGVPVMVNLSDGGLSDSEFVVWLKRYLSESQHLSLKLVIEVSEEAAVNHPAVLDDLFSHCRKLGVDYGIDRFGHYFDKLADLAALQPKYIKLDISYLEGSGVDSSFVSAMAKLAKIQDIELFAARVETDSQLAALRSLPVSAYQGYIEPPADLL